MPAKPKKAPQKHFMVPFRASIFEAYNNKPFALKKLLSAYKKDYSKYFNIP